MKDSLFKYPPVSVRYLVNEKTFISLVPKNLQKVSLFYLKLIRLLYEFWYTKQKFLDIPKLV